MEDVKEYKITDDIEALKQAKRAYYRDYYRRNKERLKNDKNRYFLRKAKKLLEDENNG